MSKLASGLIRHHDHIVLEPIGQDVCVTAGNVEIARSPGNAVLMREGEYSPVVYLPFSDICFDLLEPSSTTSHCPFKGDASYWRLIGDDLGLDILWAYEDPIDGMEAIKNFAAFYSDRVTISIG